MSSDYTHQILEFLQDEYELKIGTNDICHGSNHRYLDFVYDGKRRRVTLHKDSVAGPNTIKMKLRDIRRELGQPPERPEKQKLRLENMMPTTLTGSGEAIPNHLPPAATIVARGTISNFESNDCLYFYLPPEIVECLDADLRYKVALIGHDSWEIGPGGACTIRLSGAKRIISASSRASGLANDLGYFANYPADYIAADGRVLVSLVDRKSITPSIKRRRRVPVEKSIIDVIPATSEPWIEPFVDVEPVPSIMSQNGRMKALLRELKAIETVGPYRLIKTKEGKWKFWADSVQLEDDA